MSRPVLHILARDQRGAAIIELALIAPVFALMTIGIVDMSNAYSRKLALEQGAHRAIEKIMQTTEDSTVELTLANEAVCQVNGVDSTGVCNTAPITLANVTVTYTLECTTGGGTSTNQQTTNSVVFDTYTCPSANTEARYIQVALTDKYTPLFPVAFAAFNSGDGTYHISAVAGMRIQ